MNRTVPTAAAAAVLASCCAGSADAHGIAGKRVFPTTLTIDDPAVADKASLPTVTHQRHGAGDDAAATRQTDITTEFAKRITEHLGISIGYGYTILDRVGQSNAYGF